MSDGGLNRLTRLSNKSRNYLNRFQKFFLIAWLVNVGEAIVVVTTVLITRPSVSSPFFYIPISVLGATTAAFVILAIIYAIPFLRSAADDVRRRKQVDQLKRTSG
ncbi:hypothetical protein DC347_00005 [Pseudarthrobacter sp. AG30]|uniref:hypothetical protein n=1 Tax=Pseudarthrobacter sp. AG30 TaxID=2249742 RepID=UPI000D65635C|nr:hypothetical protein [Pseudarthrobacter sp. AG30]RAX18501.1 hypothetical protein DC347_00005 [Pseudarthrobacter sp. AG30]